MLDRLKAITKQLPILKPIIAERNQLRIELAKLQAEFHHLQQEQGFVPAGHYYSPIPAWDEIEQKKDQIFGQMPTQIPGIELHPEEQFHLLQQFLDYYPEIPFQPQKTKGLRYFYENASYMYSDAIFLHCMIRYLSPQRLIEIGSGYSSCVTLDTNDLFCNGEIQTTFIEPYPQLLESLLTPSDQDTVKIIPSKLQDVDLSIFETLEANDILFVDSTHVSKVNSDVNQIIFEILPRLASGVYIHFHDIFFPFEYPKVWIDEGRAWNEAYLLRGFLQYNSEFRVVLMNTFMQLLHESFFQENMPLCLENRGCSLWLRKL
ncbi:MAG: class I SAM-dependent methyltransferase [Leptolyngbya sp. SIOISBB]|nr:class I SAM-dependent methyltransferase [Leptolyngbya sp. SIOISBB]